MRVHELQVDYLARIVDAEGKAAHIERPIIVKVIETLSGAMSEKLPVFYMLVIDGEPWFRPRDYVSDANDPTAGLTLYTTAMQHWHDGETYANGQTFAPLHSHTSRQVAQVLYEFRFHPRETSRLHVNQSYDMLKLHEATEAIKHAECAVLAALPYMTQDRVCQLVNSHYAKLAEGQDPARILTGLPTDVLG